MNGDAVVPTVVIMVIICLIVATVIRIMTRGS